MKENKILGTISLECESQGAFLLTESQIRLLEYLNRHMGIDIDWNPLNVAQPKEI